MSEFNFTHIGLLLECRVSHDDMNDGLEDFDEESAKLFNVMQLNPSVQMVTQPIPLSVQDKDYDLIDNFVGGCAALQTIRSRTLKVIMFKCEHRYPNIVAFEAQKTFLPKLLFPIHF